MGGTGRTLGRLQLAFLFALSLLALVRPGASRAGSGLREIHLDLGGYLDGLAVVDAGGGSRQLPRWSAVARLDASMADYAARVETRGALGGPFEGADAGFFNLAHAYQNLSPSLDFTEAWVERRFRRLDVRAGIQKFSWGKLDGTPPTDVVSPIDYHDPILTEIEEAKIGVPAIRVSYFPSDPGVAQLSQLRATLIYIPFAVPSRLPLDEERWFPPTIDFSDVTVTRAQQREAGFDFEQDISVPVDFRLANDTPPRNFEAGGIGVRLSGIWREVDWDLYHYTGPETAPNSDLFAVATLDASAPFAEGVSATAILRQEHDVIHMTGFDFATASSATTVRGEAAFFKDRHYLRVGSDVLEDVLETERLGQVIADLITTGQADVPAGNIFVARDSIEWGVGMDHFVGGYLPLLQLNQIVVLEDTPLLTIARMETRLTASLQKSFWRDRLEVDLRGVYAFERGGWFALPRLAYRPRDDLRLRLGYLAVGGPRTSLIGQYRQNDEVVFEARFSF